MSTSPRSCAGSPRRRLRAALRGGPVLRRPHARGARRPRRALAGARRAAAAFPEPPAADERAEALPWLPAPQRRAAPRHFRSIWAAPEVEASPALRFLRRASASSSRPPTPSASASATARACRASARRATSVARQRRAARRGAPAGTVFLEDAARDADERERRSSEPAASEQSEPRVAEALVTLALAGYYEAWWIQIIKALVIFGIALSILPLVIVYERKLLGRFQGRYGPNRVGPYGLHAAARRDRQVRDQGAVRGPRTSVGPLFALAPGDLDHHRGRGVRAHPLRRRAAHLRHARRPLRRRRLDRPAVRLRVRRDRLLRADARRLGVGLEVLVPRRDARRRAADLLRGLAGARADRA